LHFLNQITGGSDKICTCWPWFS